MTEAEILFNQVYGRWLSRVLLISSFRIASHVGTELAREALKQLYDRVVEESDKLFFEKKVFFETVPSEKLSHALSEMTINDTRVAVDEASIVFAHSVLDAAAFDYCRVTALVAPKDWESVVGQRQIKLSDLKGASYEQILRQKLDDFFEQLERESLLKKADYLFARCTPPEGWSPMPDYIYDRDRLQKLDDYRHEVIHGKGTLKGIAAAEQEVEYLTKTVLFFLGLVNLRHGLKIDRSTVFTGNELPF